MAFEVIRNNVALSVTCLIFSPMSPPTRNPSSSDKDLCAQDTVRITDFRLFNNNLEVKNNVKYLGHFITGHMTDDNDIYDKAAKCKSRV